MIGVDRSGVHADHTPPRECASLALHSPRSGSDRIGAGVGIGAGGVHGFHTDRAVDRRDAAVSKTLKSMIYKCINHYAAIPPPQRPADQ